MLRILICDGLISFFKVDRYEIVLWKFLVCWYGFFRLCGEFLFLLLYVVLNVRLIKFVFVSWWVWIFVVCFLILLKGCLIIIVVFFLLGELEGGLYRWFVSLMLWLLNVIFCGIVMMFRLGNVIGRDYLV